MGSEEKFLISIVSKNGDFCISEKARKTFEERFPGSTVSLTPNNSANITVVNNAVLELAKTRGYDFVVMLHSDVELDLVGLAEHVLECGDRYDVMGLCGCEKISVSESPLNWFCGSRKYPGSRWGCVTHGELGNRTSFFSSRSPNVRDHSVACIDGLCIIFTKRAILSPLRFDERLRFNCYDTQISLDAVMNYGFRLGCLVETGLRHYSVGKSILGDDFLKDEIVLRERFGFEVPSGSRLDDYINETKTRV